MANLKHISGVRELRAKFLKDKAKALKDAHVSYIVGYSTSYALYVHENVEMKWKGLDRIPPDKGKYWDPQGRGQSKFLEQPARELQFELGYMVATGVKNGATVSQAMYLAGLRLLRESKKLVPVNFGFLKASGFIRKE